MEIKNCSRRDSFKLIGGLAAVAMTGCPEKPPEDNIVHLKVCNVGIDINLSQDEVVFRNFSDQPIYVEIRDEADHLLGYNILFSIDEVDKQPIYVDYGQSLFISTWKVEPQTLEYEFCEEQKAILPREEEFAANEKIVPEKIEGDEQHPLGLYGQTDALNVYFEEMAVNFQDERFFGIAKLFKEALDKAEQDPEHWKDIFKEAGKRKSKVGAMQRRVENLIRDLFLE